MQTSIKNNNSKATLEKVVMKNLAEDERRHLAKELFQVHQHVFEGHTEETFYHKVIGENSGVRTVFVLRDLRTKEAVGYCSIHLFDFTTDNKKIKIIRICAGVLRNYRRNNYFAMVCIREIIATKLTNPGAETYYLGCPVHPSSYKILHREPARVYPRPGQPMPAHIRAILTNLEHLLGLDRVPDTNPDAPLYKIGWVTKDDLHDQNHWANSEEPIVKFYVEANPDFYSGIGLLLLIPVDLTNILLTSGRVLWRRLGKLWSRRTSGRMGVPPLQPPPRPQQNPVP